MAVKTLRKIFEYFFEQLPILNLFCELYFSISKKRTPFSPLQTKVIFFAVLCSKYWFYDFDATNFQKIFKNFLILFFF